MCKMKMAVDTMVLDKVTLIPDQLLMYDKEETATLFEDMEYEDTDLTMFTIKSLDLVHRNSSRPEKGIMMRIILKRKATMELMTPPCSSSSSPSLEPSLRWSYLAMLWPTT